MGSDKFDFKNVLDKVGIPTNILKKRSKNYKRKHTSNKEGTGSTDQGEVVYRNRALERSQLKEEYKKVQEEYELFKKQTEEESRYMGGDEEHTHLVKGLDYKLLEKVKRQLEAKPSEPAEGREVNEGSDFCFTEFGFYFYKKFFYHTNLNNINFNRKLNQTIELLTKGYKFKTNKIQNITYNFNTANEDLPSIIINDNTGNTSNDLIANNLEIKKELIEVFNWHMENRKKKKLERLPFRPETVVAQQEKEEDSEDDIYQNIEKYKPDEINPEIMSSLLDSSKGLDSIQTTHLEGTSATRTIIDEESKDMNREKGTSSHPTKGLTYQIPEKLLKRSKFVPKSDTLTFQEDIDLDDSDDEYVDHKHRRRGKEGKEWNKIQELMKEKELSVENYQLSTSSTDKGGNKGFKLV